METNQQGTVRIKKNVSTRTIMYGWIFVVFNLLCYFQLIGFSAGSVLLTALLLVLGVLIRYDEIGIYLFICLAFFNVMNSGIQTTSMFYLLCGIVVIRYLLQEKKKYCFPQKIILLCIIFLLTAYNLPNTYFYLRWLILLLSCIMLYHENIIIDKITDIINLFSAAFIVASAWGYIMIKNGMAIWNGSAQYFSDRLSYLRFAGLVGDSVVYGGFLLVLIAANLVMFLANGQKPWLRIFFIAAMIIFGALTYSKTFLGGVLIELVFFLWFWLYKKKGKLSAFIFTLLGTGIIMGALSLWLSFGTDEVASIINERMSAKDLSTGRFGVWAYYIDLLSHDWTVIFKGIGFAEYTRKRTIGLVTVKYVHNIFIESVAAFGLLETIAVLTAMATALKRFFREHAELFWLIPAFMLFVVFGMTTHGHFESPYYFFSLLALTIPSAEARKNISCIGKSEV